MTFWQLGAVRHALSPATIVAAIRKHVSGIVPSRVMLPILSYPFTGESRFASRLSSPLRVGHRWTHDALGIFIIIILGVARLLGTKLGLKPGALLTEVMPDQASRRR